MSNAELNLLGQQDMDVRILLQHGGHNPCFRTALQHSNSFPDAADLLQRALVRCVGAEKTGNGEFLIEFLENLENPVGYLNQIIANLVKDDFKKLAAYNGQRQTTSLTDLPFPEEDTESCSPDKQAANQELIVESHKIIAKWEPVRREIFERRIFGGELIQQIASDLSLSRYITQQELNRAINELRQRFQ